MTRFTFSAYHCWSHLSVLEKKTANNHGTCYDALILILPHHNNYLAALVLLCLLSLSWGCSLSGARHKRPLCTENEIKKGVFLCVLE